MIPSTALASSARLGMREVGHDRSDKSQEDLARMFNSHIRGLSGLIAAQRNRVLFWHARASGPKATN
jgi:hypothetical protein